MTPGLTNWHREIKSGDITAVTLKNDIPIAVGVAAFDIGKLSKAAGEKGKAVYLVHCYKDDLWALGTKSHPPLNDTHVSITGLEDSAQQLSLESDPLKLDDVPTDAIEGPPEEMATLLQGSGTSEPSISGDLPSCTKLNN